LVYGFASGQKTISQAIVREVIADKQQFSIFPVQGQLQHS
jgi:general secretion pathway protein A